MDDTKTDVAYQGPGQAPGTTPTVSPEKPQGEVTRQFVTEEAERIAQARADEALRKAQSYFDRDQIPGAKKVQARLESLEQRWNVLAQAGLSLTDDEKKAEKLAEARKVLTEIESERATGVPSQPPQVDPITAQAADFEKELSVEIKDGDPEIATIKTNGTPWEYLTSYRQALEAKRQRIAQQVNPPTHTPTSLGGTGQPTNLEQQYIDTKKKLRGNVRAITDLRKEYAQKGLDVNAADAKVKY